MRQIFLLVVAVAISAIPALSREDILTGFTSMTVVVILSHNQKDVVDEERTSAIRTATELRFRRMGINVPEVQAGAAGKAIVVIETADNVDLEGLLAYSAHLYIKAPGDVRNFRKLVTIWESGRYGTVGTKRAKASLLMAVERFLDLFENDWRAENPTPKTQPTSSSVVQ